jgi:leucyl aminopeptidase (aminopeptidase T)
MFNVSERLRGIAKKVMDSALPIQRDQVAVFYAGLENLDLAYAFAAECGARGIETLVRSQGDYISNAKLLEAPIDSFARIPRIPEALIGVADWFIFMTGSRFDTAIYQNSGLRERMIEIQKVSKFTVSDLLQLCLSKQTHLVAFLDPNLQQAQALGRSYEATRKLFLSSLDIDYQALTELGNRIIRAVDKGGQIHLTCPKGSDLRLQADGRVWINDDGRIWDPNESPTGISPYIHNLPVGEVFVAPLETRAHGVVYPKSLPGAVSEGICIEFKGAKAVTLSAEKGYDFLKVQLDKATGNPYSIAEFAFGTNPCGDMLLATEKAYGTCHVAIGQNTWLGGKNDCSVHWDFLIDNPTVTIDGQLILNEGEFTL